MSPGLPTRPPSGMTASLAELWPDERRVRTRVVEGVGDARLLGLSAKVIAVVEDDGAGALEGRHGGRGGARGARTALVFLGLGRAQRASASTREISAERTTQRIVRRRSDEWRG